MHISIVFSRYARANIRAPAFYIIRPTHYLDGFIMIIMIITSRLYYNWNQRNIITMSNKKIVNVEHWYILPVFWTSRTLKTLKKIYLR